MQRSLRAEMFGNMFLHEVSVHRVMRTEVIMLLDSSLKRAGMTSFWYLQVYLL